MESAAVGTKKEIQILEMDEIYTYIKPLAEVRS